VLNHYGGPEWRETAERKALRILAEKLKRCGWLPDELPRRPKGGLHKITIARPLRAQTTLTWAWIAHHLSLGAPGSVANRLRNSQP
jgi:plasmid replication initiation protein